VYRITFEIPSSLKESYISYLCFEKVKKELDFKKILKALTQVIKNRPKIKLTRIPGKHNCLGYYDWPPPKNNLVVIDYRIQLNEFPGIVIHELFHVLFPQLVERDILKLELFFIDKIKKKDLNNLIILIWKYCNPEYTDWKKKISIKITKRK